MTLPALAVTAEAVLRALAGEPHASLTALAEASGTAVRNMNARLASLAKKGLIERPGGAPSHRAVLTAAGHAALAALDRAAGAARQDSDDARADVVWLTVDQLAPDPDQPRKHSGLDDAAIEALACSILERHGEGLPGLITPPTVRPAPADPAGGGGTWLIVSGERRWRAWQAAIRLRTWNRDPLPADTAFPCPVFRGTAAQAAVHAAVENLQRADLDDLEWADHFAAMAAADPALSGARIAELLGKPGPSGERWVQERLRVAHRATPEARAAYLESRRLAQAGEDDPDPFTWTRLRDSVKVAVQKPKPHVARLAAYPALRLLILEMALRSAQAHGGLWDGFQPYDMAVAEDDEVWRTATLHELLRASREGQAALTRRAIEWIADQDVASRDQLADLTWQHVCLVEGKAFEPAPGVREWTSAPLRCGEPEPRSGGGGGEYLRKEPIAVTPGVPIVVAAKAGPPTMIDEDGAVLGADAPPAPDPVAFLDDPEDENDTPPPYLRRLAGPVPDDRPAPGAGETATQAREGPASPPPAVPLRQATLDLHRAATAQAALVDRWLGADVPTWAQMHDAHKALTAALTALRPWLPGAPEP